MAEQTEIPKGHDKVPAGAERPKEQLKVTGRTDKAGITAALLTPHEHSDKATLEAIQTRLHEEYQGTTSQGEAGGGQQTKEAQWQNEFPSADSLLKMFQRKKRRPFTWADVQEQIAFGEKLNENLKKFFEKNQQQADGKPLAWWQLLLLLLARALSRPRNAAAKSLEKSNKQEG